MSICFLSCQDQELIVNQDSSASYSTEELTESAFPKTDDKVENQDYLYTIVIDPGHGGKDYGCSGHLHAEKDITLAFALRLGASLNAYCNQVEVLYTRHEDVSIPLNQRIKTANQSRAAMFISIHANSYEDASIHGFETYIYGQANDEISSRVSMRENSQLAQSKEQDISDYIMANIEKTEQLERSIDIAASIDKQVKNVRNYNNRGVRQAEFRVLKNAQVPSLLLEIGYLTNKKDNIFLSNPKRQESLSDKIALGIINTLKSCSHKG